MTRSSLSLSLVWLLGLQPDRAAKSGTVQLVINSMIYSDPSSPGADGDSHHLFLSIHLSIHLFISLSLPSVSIYPSIYVSLVPSSPFPLFLLVTSSRHHLPSLSVSRTPIATQLARPHPRIIVGVVVSPAGW